MAHTPCKGKTAQPRAVALGNRHICQSSRSERAKETHTLCFCCPCRSDTRKHTPYPAMPRAEKQVGPSARIRPNTASTHPTDRMCHTCQNGRATCEEYAKPTPPDSAFRYSNPNHPPSQILNDLMTAFSPVGLPPARTGGRHAEYALKGQKHSGKSKRNTRLVLFKPAPARRGRPTHLPLSQGNTVEKKGN